MAIDITAAARNYRKRQQQKEADRQERLKAMRATAATMVAHIRDTYRPLRIYQWGSLLNPRQFSAISDIDIAVEGVTEIETWLQLEKDLFEMTSYPLDLIRWENLWPEHKERILQRGVVVFERDQEEADHG